MKSNLREKLRSYVCKKFYDIGPWSVFLEEHHVDEGDEKVGGAVLGPGTIRVF
jgi:hypothetical protein